MSNHQLYQTLGALVLILAQLVSAEETPTVQFSVTPSDFSVGTQFSSKCIIDGFDPTTKFQYSVVFYVKPTDSRVLAKLKKSPRIDLEVASWTVYPQSTYTVIS